MPARLQQQYRNLKGLVSSPAGLGEGGVSDLMSEMALYARELLGRVDRVQLTSRVPAKRYFGFRGPESSRPVNEALYVVDEAEFAQLLNLFRDGFRRTSPEEIVRCTYTIAYSVLAANDSYGIGRKASATFFEVLIGHIVARAIGVAPRKRVRIPESGADLPTDYVFDPGPNSLKIHLPIKTSTRERGVQAWVHQLVLERIFGDQLYRGIFVVGAETKRNTRTGEVIEICVPRQLQMFQARVARISRVYYLDPPQVYLDLARAFPQVDVRSFGQILQELPDLLRP